MNYHFQYHPGMTMEDAKKRMYLMAMQAYGNNKTQAAKSLGISVRTLEERLKEYGATEAQLKKSRDQYERDQAVRLDRERNGSRADAKRVDDRIQSAKVEGEAQSGEAEKQRAFLDRCRQSTGLEIGRKKSAKGHDVESSQGPSARDEVPMREHEEVQDVLSADAPKGRARA